MRARLFAWSLTSALAGFLFGFDTVVISGAEQKIQALWGLTPAQHGLAIAAALYGTVAGSLFGGWPTDRFGRRRTLLSIGLLYIVGALWSALATNVTAFAVARAIGGLGIGISTVAAPLYISEIAPTSYRGRLAGLFQFNIVFGILVAFLSNAMLAGLGEHAWRWMLGVMAVPALVYTVFCVGLPESPRWLLTRKQDRSGGLAVLRRIEPELDERAIDARADAIIAGAMAPESVSGFWNRGLRTPIVLAFLIAFFNQLSGINAILYFAPRIFEMTGLGERAALFQSVGIGLTNFVFTFVGLWLIDRAGRRALLLIGSFGYIASLGLTTGAFFSGHVSIVPACIFGFIAAHAIGQGAVIWVYISEIFPDTHRAHGQALGSFTHWTFAALLTTFFPRMVSAYAPWQVFAFFTGMMMLQLLWVLTMVRETKNVPLEQMRARMNAKA